MNSMYKRLSRIGAVILGFGALIAAPLAVADPYSQNFDAWPYTGTAGLGQPKFVTTNNSDWAIVNAAVGGPTNLSSFPSPASDPHACWLNAFVAAGTNTWLESPVLSDGIGQVTFRTTGKLAENQVFVLQISTNGSPWMTRSTYTNSSATFWRTNTLALTVYEPARMRIRKTQDNGSSQRWLGIDNVVIDPAPPPVTLSNPQRTPTSPAEAQSVTVRIDVTPEPGVSNLTCFARFRHTDDTTYGSVAMALESGVTYKGTIPPGPVGAMRYYFECYAEGYALPAVYPEDAPGAGTLAYTNLVGMGSSREQDFDDWPFTGKIGGGTFAKPIFTNSSFQGWTAYDASISGKSNITAIPVPASLPHGCWLNALDQGREPYLLFPMMTNAVSRLYFASYSKSASPQIFNVETSLTGAAETWGIAREITQTAQAWHTNSIALNAEPPLFVRIRKTEDLLAPGAWLGFDNIVLSYPPADAVISGAHYSPAYPGNSQDVTVYCTVTSAPTLFPAYGFAPTVYHKNESGSWTAAPMADQGNGLYAGTVPAYDPGTISYYIRCAFGGYYFKIPTTNENQSPAFLPDASHTAERPSTFFSYPVRYFESAYSNVVITGNVPTVTMEMVSNDVWQGVLPIGTTNQIAFSFMGLNKLDSSNGSPTDDSWADPLQLRANPPVVGTFATNGNPIVITGSTSEQYMVRFDLANSEYIVLRCDFQNFDDWALHDTLFATGSQGAGFRTWQQNFDTWALNVDEVDVVDFQDPDWTNYPSYPGWQGEYSEMWVANNFRIVNKNDFKLELVPSEDAGYIRQASWRLFDGEGELDFDYRATDTNCHVTTRSGGTTWANYTLSAYIGGADSSDDDGPYHSIFYHYTAPNAYYECRAVQTNEANLRVTLYKRTPSAFSSLGATTIDGKLLNNAASWNIQVTNQGGSVKHIIKYGGADKINVTDSSSPLPAGTVGFGACDANMAIDSVSINLYTNILDETFDSPNPTGWTTNSTWNVQGGAYVRKGRAADPLGLRVFTFPMPLSNLDNPDSHVVHTNVSGLTSLDYTHFALNIHTAQQLVTVIDHTDGNGSLRLDNIVLTSWHGKTNQYNSWLANDSFVTADNPYGGSGRSLELRASRALSTRGYSQYLRSPLLDNAGAISFYYRTPNDAAPADVQIQWQNRYSSTWSDERAVSLDSGGGWTSYSYPLNINVEGYLRIAHTSAVDDVDARLVLDRVVIYDYHEADTNSWIAYNALITPNEEDKLFRGVGKSGYLNHSNNANIFSEAPYTNYSPYFQTPFMPNGIGEISFFTRMWDMGRNGAKLRVEKARTESGPWTLVANPVVDWTVYRQLSFPHFDESNHYVRVSNTITGAIPDRLCIDNLLVTDPLATDLVVTNVYTVPRVPLTNDLIKVRADLTDYLLGPEVVGVTCFVYVTEANWGKWGDSTGGVFKEPMHLIATDTSSVPAVYTYETIDPIVPVGLPVDIVVQYYVKAYFSGRLLAEYSSPRRFKEEFQNPSWYEPADYNQTYGGGTNIVPYVVIFSSPTNSVWINEVNVEQFNWPFGALEYVELGGKANTDIKNWRIRFVNTDYTTQGQYTISTNPTLHRNPTNGYAFWVLGDATNAIQRDQTFTNTPDFHGFNMPYPQGGIQLLRSMGACEHAVSYGTIGGYLDAEQMQEEGYEFIGINDFTLYSPLALVGSSLIRDGFAWTNNVGSGNYTPGRVNVGQAFNDVPDTVELTILDFWKNSTSFYIRCLGTNFIEPEPIYATNLTQTPIAWHTISPYSSTYPTLSNGTYTMWFNRMTNLPAYFFRVKADL
jgi:hypothetical protein